MEGYIESREKRGYFVTKLETMPDIVPSKKEPSKYYLEENNNISIEEEEFYVKIHIYVRFFTN